jgi:alpha-D-xyloside xylohydrolase
MHDAGGTTDHMKTFLAALLLSTAICTVAAAAPIPVLSVQQNADGVTLKMQPGVMHIQVCAPRVIHVEYSPKVAIPAKTEVIVNRQWTPVPIKVKDDPAELIISTNQLSVHVNRASGAVRFFNADGKVVLSEPADGGKVMTPATVNNEDTFHAQQTFDSPPDECLYGMAEAQDGTWNWRGMPIELRQLNTQAALPVLISTKGYGLLWDNASLTEFNPVDDEVPLRLETPPATEDASAPRSTEQLRATTQRRGKSPLAIRHGTFTSGEAGDYVFFARNGDRRDEIGIAVDGQILANIKNMWVPYTIAGRMTLPAKKVCNVTVRGGGKGVQLFARPLGDKTVFRSEVGDAIDYYFFYGPALDDCVAEYRDATGAAPLWPKWAYGFWQCRERYSSQQQILDAVAEFRKEQIPIDLIVQDWQWWTGGWSSYHWDPTHYPDPAAMTKSLHDQHVHFMISVWSNPAGDTHAELKQHHGTIGNSNWFDAFSQTAREIRWKHINQNVFSFGTDAWWQDATEPGDDGNEMEDSQVSIGSGSRYRNAYPLFANECIYDGQRATDPSKRVCILTRSSFPGQQRYAAGLWSGDVNGNWETFRKQIPAGLNVCLTGLPYWTTDCAGFFRPHGQYTSQDYNELLVRWFEFSTFCPILRVHGYQTETEMWKWPLAKATLLKFDQLRYRLLPYNYSVAWKVTHEGYTIMRALPMDFPADPKVDSISDQYMFGPAFLVSPVTQPRAASREVYLPAGTTWTNFWTGQTSDGGQQIDVPAPREILPLFVRAGSIIPIGPALQYASEKPADPIELRIYPGADGNFNLYEDEGDSYDYEKGVYAVIPIRWNDAAKTLTIGARQGQFPGILRSRTFSVAFIRPHEGFYSNPSTAVEVAYNGTPVTLGAH